MKEFDPIPTCCEECTAAECDRCEGLDENCPSYQAAMAVEADTQQRFERDYEVEIAASKAMNWDDPSAWECDSDSTRWD